MRFLAISKSPPSYTGAVLRYDSVLESRGSSLSSIIDLYISKLPIIHPYPHQASRSYQNATSQSDNNILEVVIRLLQLIIEKQVILRYLKLGQVELLSSRIPDNMECRKNPASPARRLVGPWARIGAFAINPFECEIKHLRVGQKGSAG